MSRPPVEQTPVAQDIVGIVGRPLEFTLALTGATITDPAITLLRYPSDTVPYTGVVPSCVLAGNNIEIAFTSAQTSTLGALAPGKDIPLFYEIAAKVDGSAERCSLMARRLTFKKLGTAHTSTSTSVPVAVTVGETVLIGTIGLGLGAAAIAAHIADTTAAHDAASIGFTPVGTIAATTVQDAIAEVAAEAAQNTAVANQLVYSRPGDLVAAAGTARFPITADGEIVDGIITIGTIANDDVIIDVNINGSSVFADAGDRPTIPAGSQISALTPIAAAVVAGDYLTLDVDQVGGISPVTVIAVTDGTGGGSSAQSQDIARPVGSAVGDIQIAALWTTVGGTVGSTTEPTTVITVPSGWTLFAGPVRSVHNSGDRDRELHLYWWRDDGLDASFAFTVTQPTVNAYFRARIITLRGCLASGDPIDVDSMVAPASSGTSWAASSVTTTTARTLLIGVWSRAHTISLTGAAVSGMTLDTVGGAEFVTGFEQRPVAGATGARTLTGTSSPFSRQIAALFAVKPEPTNTVPGADLTAVLTITRA